MSVRAKAELVGAVAKINRELKNLDNKVSKAKEAVNKAENNLLRLEMGRDRTQDRLDDALAYYDGLEVIEDG